MSIRATFGCLAPLGLVLVLVALPIASGRAAEEDLASAIARVDKALQTNPNRAANRALLTCRDRRDRAAQLVQLGEKERARRSLAYCFNLLGIPEHVATKVEAPDAAERARAEADKKRQAEAARDFERALSLEPDIDRGLEIYRNCAACHGPEGWGLGGAGVPQLAGQHRRVLIEQLVDIRGGNRENLIMLPYASVEAIGGAQAVADVTGYIGTLEITTDNGKGPGDELERGAQLYAERCVGCHDLHGEGDDQARIPRIQAQHYHYLVAQFEQIRDGRRKIENEKKRKLLEELEDDEIHAIMDHVSRLEPPEALQAPPGWRNPDFLP